MIFNVKFIGNSQQPIVTIDDFFADYDAVVKLASCSTDFTQEQGNTNFYPGKRSPLPQSLLDSISEKLKPVIAEVFALNVQYPEWQEGYFSVVDMPAETLVPLQRVPHFDSCDKRQVAAVIYLCGPEFGGTGFYRHLETDLELISEKDLAHYQSSVLKQLNDIEFDGYCVDSNCCFEQISKVEAKPNRLVLYRSALLHSGIITDKNFDVQYDAKRLTITVFMYF